MTSWKQIVASFAAEIILNVENVGAETVRPLHVQGLPRGSALMALSLIVESGNVLFTLVTFAVAAFVAELVLSIALNANHLSIVFLEEGVFVTFIALCTLTLFAIGNPCHFCTAHALFGVWH